MLIVRDIAWDKLQWTGHGTMTMQKFFGIDMFLIQGYLAELPQVDLRVNGKRVLRTESVPVVRGPCCRSRLGLKDVQYPRVGDIYESQ